MYRRDLYSTVYRSIQPAVDKDDYRSNNIEYIIEQKVAQSQCQKMSEYDRDKSQNITSIVYTDNDSLLLMADQ